MKIDVIKTNMKTIITNIPRFWIVFFIKTLYWKLHGRDRTRPISTGSNFRDINFCMNLFSFMLILAYLAYPQDTGPKLKVLKMFKRRPGEVQGVGLFSRIVKFLVFEVFPWLENLYLYYLYPKICINVLR